MTEFDPPERHLPKVNAAISDLVRDGRRSVPSASRCMRLGRRAVDHHPGRCAAADLTESDLMRH